MLEQTFLKTLQGIADYVANTITREVIRPVVHWNFGETVRVPYLACTNIVPSNYSFIADTLSKLTAYVRPGEKIDAHLRDLMNIPQEEIEEKEETQEEPEADAKEVETEDDESEIKAHQKGCSHIKAMTGLEIVKTGDSGFWRQLRADEEYLALNTMKAELKDLYYRLDGIQAERFGVGMPYAKELEGANATVDTQNVS